MATEHKNTLEVRDLVAQYGDRRVLSGVNVVVAPAEVRAILGGSGAGKTTLLRHMIGLAKPVRGSVRLLGVDLNEADETERESVMANVGMLFQGGALFNSMTVLDNVALPIRERHDLPDDILDEVVRMKLELVGLSGAADLHPPELSGGMRTRAGLARALALDPVLLFCDEPTARLDPVTAADIDRLLADLNERFGMSLVVVTHELASINNLAHTVTMIADGVVVADGPLGAVRSSPNPLVRSFFDRRGDGQRGRVSVFEALHSEVVA